MSDKLNVYELTLDDPSNTLEEGPWVVAPNTTRAILKLDEAINRGECRKSKAMGFVGDDPPVPEYKVESVVFQGEIEVL